MIVAEVKRIWQVKVFRLWLLAVIICMLMENGVILLQYHSLIFDEEYKTEVFRQREYEETYLLRVEEKMDQLNSQKDSILFSNPETQLVLSKEIENTEVLQMSAISLQHTDLFKRILSLIPFWSAFYLLSGIFLSYELFIRDDEAGLSNLYASTCQSRKKRAVSKLTILIAFPLLISLVKTILEHGILYYCGVSGKIPIQAINGYFTSGIHSDIAGYINLVNGRSVLGVILAVLIFVLLYIVCNSWNISAGLLLLFIVAEYLSFTFISEASSFSVIKNVNLYVAMFSSMLYNGYTAVLLMPLNRTILFIVILAVMCCTMVFFVIKNFGSKANQQRLNTKRKHLRSPRTMTGFHIKEILIAKKGIIIFLLLFIFCLSNAMRMDSVRTADEIRYDTFKKQYYGEINDQLLQKVETDRQTILNAITERDEYLSHLNTLNDQQRAKLEELIKLTSQAEDMEKLYLEVTDLYNAGAHNFTDHSGIQYLMRKDDLSGSVMDFLMCILPASFMAITVITAEHKGIMAKLIDSSAIGKKIVLHNYAKLLFLFLMMIIFIVYGFQAVRVSNGYSLDLSGTVNEVLGIQSKMPVWLYVFLHYLNIILLANTLLLGTEASCVHLSLASSLILCMTITVSASLIPFVSEYIGFSYVNHISIYCIFSLCLIGIIRLCAKYM